MIWNYSRVKTVWFEFAKTEGAKIISHLKSPTFIAAKVFTVLQDGQSSQNRTFGDKLIAVGFSQAKYFMDIVQVNLC